MKFDRLLVIALLVAGVFTGCGNDKKISVKGSYGGEKGEWLYLTRLDVDIPVFIDSVRIRGNGEFKTSFEATQPEFYTLGFSDNDFITIVGYPGDQITVTFGGENLGDGFIVEGSPETEEIRNLDIKLAETLARLDSVSEIFQSIPDLPENEARLSELESLYLEIIKAQRMHNIKFIIENLRSFASIKALYQRFDETAYVLYQPNDAQYLKLVTDTLGKYYPASKQVRALQQNLQNELDELNRSRISRIAQDAATTDLDLYLADVNGKRVRLSEVTRGKHVLLLFWSANSRECITNNIQLKEYYSRYKKAGFEIYAVNIDQDEEIWKQAVRFDELPWINVRVDDPETLSEVSKFNVTRVPANYMYGPDGSIVAKELFGRSLQIKLSQLFD